MLFNASVEEKLNELLDAEGGISKRKVSPNDFPPVDLLNFLLFYWLYLLMEINGYLIWALLCFSISCSFFMYFCCVFFHFAEYWFQLM